MDLTWFNDQVDGVVRGESTEAFGDTAEFEFQEVLRRSDSH